MTKPEPQEPPERTLRRWTGTRLLGGTTSDNSLGPDPVTGSAGGRPPKSGQAAPLLPPRARRRAAITAACCAIVVAVLAAFAVNRSQGNAVDRPVDSWLRQHLGSHLHLLSDISYLGGGQATAVLTVILIAACLVARRLNAAVLTLVSVAVAAGLTEYVLKPLVHETIRGSLTYPSGHTSSLFTLIAVIGVLLVDTPRQRPRPAARLLLMAGLVIIGCLVAVAVIGLRYHYFTDTIAGAAWGTCVALTATFLVDMPGVRRLLGATRLSRRRDS
jgi:membrane-associated phospholipid phosphatase